jgi:hypothetical protein
MEVPASTGQGVPSRRLNMRIRKEVNDGSFWFFSFFCSCAKELILFFSFTMPGVNGSGEGRRDKGQRRQASRRKLPSLTHTFSKYRAASRPAR